MAGNANISTSTSTTIPSNMVTSPSITKASAATSSPKKQINLLRGWPNPSLLPTSQIQAASNRVLNNPDVSNPALLYGPDEGPLSLRRSVATWLCDFYSEFIGDRGIAVEGKENVVPVNAKKEEEMHSESKKLGIEKDKDKEKEYEYKKICITGGASQNLACILQVYSDPVMTRVWMVTPGYYLAGNIFSDNGLRVGAVGEGEEGVDLEGLEGRIRGWERERERMSVKEKPLKTAKPYAKIYKNIIYCVPTFSNPSGKIMSLDCRTKLVLLARRYDALVISDDVYDFLQWSTTSSSTTPLKKALLPRLIDIDRSLPHTSSLNSNAPSSHNPDPFGNTISNGSFSKIVGPGVRVGWAAGSKKIIYGLGQTGSSRSGGCPSQFMACVMDEMLRGGELEEHIYGGLKGNGGLQKSYRERWGRLMRVVGRELGGLGVEVENCVDGEGEVFGGFFIWLRLPKGVDGEVVTERALREEDLIVAPGRIFEVEGDESVRLGGYLRICLAWEEVEELVEGIGRLGRVVRGILEEGNGGEKKGGVGDDRMELGRFY